MQHLTVFYTPEQVAKTKSFSKSPSKPKLVVKDWLKHFSEKLHVSDFLPVTREQLKLVHSERYVDGVLDGTVVNGFGNTDSKVAASLLYTSGSMLAAARHALNEGIAVAPVSGFHHACYNGGGSFCTFDGLSLTAAVLKEEGLVSKVGILDCDYHYGNGTVDIIKRLGLDYIQHYTAGFEYHYPDQACDFIDRLKQRVKAFKGVDVLLYQAGADPWIGDELGGFLTMDQLQYRDRVVFETCKSEGIPLVWDLAGGYAEEYEDTIMIHRNTMKECLKVYCD